MSELDDLLDPGVKHKPEVGSGGSGEKLPNANATLTLGIISIVGCWLYAVPGIICGIIALAIHRKDKALYLSNPERYEQSWKNAKAGNICAIIGTSISSAYLLLLIIGLLFVTSMFARF